jgi:predicted RecB family nuclease
MQLIGDSLVFAATDLVGFLACEHLVGLELAAMAGLVERPIRNDPEIDLVARRGLEHEARFLATLEAEGKRIARIPAPPRDVGPDERLAALREAASATATAMRDGADAVYQAAFFDGRWLGLADFLVRVDRPSALGDWSYEVVDTKLARHVKASAILQICSYAEQLTAIQGVEPEWMHVALGGSAREVARHRVPDYMAYYRAVKAAFEARVAADGGHAGATYPPLATYPEPVEHCDVCRWSVVCAGRRRADDDLSLVANAPTRLRRALKGRGVASRRGLAALELPLAEPLDGVGPAALSRAREQAAIQVRGSDEGKVIYELLEPERLRDGTLAPDRGLTSLPEPRQGDLFFDIEGDPFALDDGVDYLFGILEPGLTGADGKPTFHAFWSIDEDGQVTPAAERRAFGQAIDLMTDRLARDPTIHVYHYAPYEPTAAGRLMGRHATREEAVDRLLRGGVFVDLFRAVRQGMRASVESYSIKKLEPLYGLTREENLRDAGSSIVAFESWLADVEAGSAVPRSPAADPALRSIEGYNRDDCVSNWLLRDWLEARRVELADRLGELLPRPMPEEPEARPDLSERLAHVRELAEQLCAGVPEATTERTEEQHARWLLAQLLSWHRREDKSFWWRYYYLLDLTDEERVAEPEPIGRLSLVGRIGERGRSTIYRYSYPEQEHEIGTETSVRDPETRGSPGLVEAVDREARTIDLRRGPRTDGPHPTSLVPLDYVDTSGLENSLLRIGEWVARNGIGGPGEYGAIRELLMRRPPRLDGGEPLCRAGEEPLDAAVRVAPHLERSVLPVQGPPGSGKTYLGAEVVVELVRRGRRVGVTANSHRVIGHFLDKVHERAGAHGVDIRIAQKPDRTGDPTCASAEAFDDYAALLNALVDGDVDVVGGTAWLWSRPEFSRSVDVLVVDEAGQLSLANAASVSPAAESLVLLGDPQQLDQPLKGAHPPGAEVSVLGHVLAAHSTMPSHLGLFLERTRRLHPDLCRFTSEVFYEGRLSSLDGLERQRIQVSDAAHGASGSGVRFVEVVHSGNRNSSPEEAATVAELVGLLTADDAGWTDERGASHRLRADDVLVVAPYNLQVEAIRGACGCARVGTVDKFQGQEAPVSIYSMATSSPEEAPRGMEFLYSLNRLNVATSRARCLSIVVASPALVRVRARNPRQMQLANALCRFLEMARGQVP